MLLNALPDNNVSKKSHEICTPVYGALFYYGYILLPNTCAFPIPIDMIPTLSDECLYAQN